MSENQSTTQRAVGMLGSVDAVPALTAFVIALIAIPSRLIVGPLGSAGTPAQVICLLLLAWWLITAVAVQGQWRGPRQPVRVAMLIFVFAVFVSYLAMALRPTESTEARAGDAAVLSVCAWLGVFLVVTDGVPTRDRLDTLLRRLVAAAGALATLGLLQFATKRQFTNYIQIPGLRVNDTLVTIYSRAGLSRPSGTAIHPIEFGAVLTMCLPLALHYAFSDTSRTLIRRWYPVGAIAIAVPISISRSAIVSTVVVLCVLIPFWPVSRRRRVYLGLVAVLMVVYVLVPGLLGTIRDLFTGISSDKSTQSRTGSYALAIQFIRRAPLFGRGQGTFLPAYRILDDQYLGSWIQTGAFGLAALVGVFLTGIHDSWRIFRDALDPRDRDLSLALLASVASALVSFATFDAFSFPMAASLLFLILGSVAALHRISHAGNAESGDDQGEISTAPTLAVTKPTASVGS